MSMPHVYTGSVEKGKFRPDSPRDFTVEFLRREGKRVVISVKEWRNDLKGSDHETPDPAMARI